MDFNHVRPHDALGGKTPAELYRNSTRRSLSPRLPSYPAEWLTRRVSGVGNVRVSGDNTFLSTALAGQLVALWRESELHWRVYYFNVDLGTIEVLPLNDAFASETVINTVTAIQAKTATHHRRTVSTNP